MSVRGKFRRHRNQQTLSSVAKETAISLPADSPILAIFKSAAVKLNDRQDRHERLVKLSRDITIESKRIIFLLHSAITKETCEKAVSEAIIRLQKLAKGPIKSIGLELENIPNYLHWRAVTPGFQEYVEARTLCSLMQTQNIITFKETQDEFIYKIEDETNNKERSVVTMLTQNDYMLGIADLTGELMRRAINSIASGDSEECFSCCQNVRDLYTSYLGVTGGSRELGRKLATTRRNVEKVECAVYALRVRGGEAPPALLARPTSPHAWDAASAHSDDEGFF
ncbi:PREDICTED: translin-associated protein X [Papilio polytes]|uniref:translin-associated protein X n=1 Tax=Papilio polytes TaxID=76194 RepID=UPI000675E12E|nr:PREDICTED: translin-associated protein X [Papilio polytes]